jgi:Icc-related predicted phosphoesterase
VGLFGKRRETEAAQARREDGALRIFYCGDIHGSDVCFRKFINAGAHYDADVLILGGDLTGKALVPIVERDDGTWHARLHGEPRTCRSPEEHEALARAIASLGFYPVDVSAARFAELEASRDEQLAVFRDEIVRQLERWVAFADERLEGSERACLVIPGNDDEDYVDPILCAGRRLTNVDGRVVTLANGTKLASLSWSNRTPWHTAREYDEPEIEARLDGLLTGLDAETPVILNLHVPPYASGLDTVRQLDDNLRPVYRNGVPVEIPCGSTAVRAAIERVQPLLGLHGHVHESRAATRIGRTLCLNPGSDYASGRLHGVLVDVTPRAVLRHEFTEG